ncbi:MAG: CsiV family protein, partial [Pseudomonadota bacterium]
MSRRSSDGRQKTRKFPRLRRIVLFAALLCTHAFALASMKDDVEAALEQRWFTVEMIVFQRLQGGTSGGEDLMLSDPRSWPAELEDRAPQTPTELWIDDPELCFGLSPVREASAWMSQGHTMDAIDAYFRPEIESRPELAEPQLDAAQVPPIEGEASQAATPQEDTAAALLADFNTRIAELAARLQAGSYKLRDDYGLQQQYLALRYSRNYRPVLHQRWSQPVPPRSATNLGTADLTALDVTNSTNARAAIESIDL